MATQTSQEVHPLRESVVDLDPTLLGSTRRVGRLMARMLAERPKLCLHRGRSYTQVFRETEGEPVEIRFAKAFARALEDLPVVIGEDELIVGAPYCKLRAGGFYPESNGAWLRDEIDGLATRQWDPFDVAAEEVAEVKEMMAYWQGKTVYDIWARHCPPDVVGRVIGKGWADSLFGIAASGFHYTLPFDAILTKGLRWYEQRVNAALASLNAPVDGCLRKVASGLSELRPQSPHGRVSPPYPSVDGFPPLYPPVDGGTKGGRFDADPGRMPRESFYGALLIVIEACRDFASKYSTTARHMAAEETRPERREELLRIARTLEVVPYEPARSFYEALEAAWFVYALIFVDGAGPVHTLGRFDRYLYPFYKADVEKGLLTPEAARELIECFCIKVNGICKVYSSEGAKASPGYAQVQTISLGGVDAAGRDASNELTYLCLEAAGNLRAAAPDIALLWHSRETPYALKMKGAALNARGFAIPKYFNTDTIKHELLEAGFSLEEANLGWIQGCAEPYGPGDKQYGHTAASMLNMPLALEAVLFNGRKRTPGQAGSGELLGVETGDCRQFQTFDEFMKAVKTQLAQQISDAHVASNWGEWVRGRYSPVLLQSLFTEACIDRGLPAPAGGAEVSVGPGIAMTGGLATLADSLAAIKKLVFEDKVLTMDDLLRAIDADFEGHQAVRNMLINKAPKYGNDIDYVDDIARDIFDFINREAHKHVGVLGNRNFMMTAFPMSNVMEGARTWATPDGRKAGQPLSAHVDPVDGMDVNGPAANLKSVSKLEQDRQFGCTHNLYLVNVDSDEQLHRLVDLVDFYFSRGGHHLQFNCQDKEVYVDAQQHPERYRSLMVRVSGYVAYFVELPREVQDQIIGRTSHRV
ncbi:MAG: hypothetical protein HYX92_15590 [Chloroflexi bacterium]|nr:hypothetical protein [Chloroflexota bacterium]